MHIKAVNKFQYSRKDGSVELPEIATCRKALTTKIQVMQGFRSCLMCNKEIEMDNVRLNAPKYDILDTATLSAVVELNLLYKKPTLNHSTSKINK